MQELFALTHERMRNGKEALQTSGNASRSGCGARIHRKLPHNVAALPTYILGSVPSPTLVAEVGGFPLRNLCPMGQQCGTQPFMHDTLWSV